MHNSERILGGCDSLRLSPEFGKARSRSTEKFAESHEGKHPTLPSCSVNGSNITKRDASDANAKMEPTCVLSEFGEMPGRASRRDNLMTEPVPLLGIRSRLEDVNSRILQTLFMESHSEFRRLAFEPLGDPCSDVYLARVECLFHFGPLALPDGMQLSGERMRNLPREPPNKRFLWRFKLARKRGTLQKHKQLDQRKDVSVIGKFQGSKVLVPVEAIDDQRCVAVFLNDEEDQGPRKAPVAISERMNLDESMVEPSGQNDRMMALRFVPPVEGDEVVDFTLHVLGRRVLEQGAIRSLDMVGVGLPLAVLERCVNGPAKSVDSRVGELSSCQCRMEFSDETGGKLATGSHEVQDHLKTFALGLKSRTRPVIKMAGRTLDNISSEALGDEGQRKTPINVVESLEDAGLDCEATKTTLANPSLIGSAEIIKVSLPFSPKRAECGKRPVGRRIARC